MKKFIRDFKAFAVKGNVVDLSVAVIIGGAFGKIVTSFVNDVIMPMFGIILGGIDFKDLQIKIGDATILYGNFMQSIVDFVIIAFCIFVAIKILTAVTKKEKKIEESKVVTEVELLTEIRDLLMKKK
jgi:large conductance mechanosensitive channel